MSKIKYQRSILQRGKAFLTANIWALWIVVGLGILWNVIVILSVTKKLEDSALRMEKVGNQISKGVVMLDMLGRPKVSVPQELTPLNPAFKIAVLNYTKLYGLYDWASLTDNFEKDVFTADDAYKENPRLRTFSDNFFLERTSQARKDFVAYITQTVFLMNKDKLPEKTSITREEVISFKVDGNHFDSKMSFKVQTYSFNGNTDKYEMREGFIVVEAIGILDPTLGTIVNPLGIKFTERFKPNILKKRR